MTKPESARERMAELFAAFDKKLVMWVRSLEDMGALLGTKGSDVDIETLRQIYEHSHKLAGTAGSYGFSGTGERALALEQYCEQLVEEARAPNTNEITDIQAMAAEICRAREAETPSEA
jgi:chemotaxis protein histidine kinase CheA